MVHSYMWWRNDTLPFGRFIWIFVYVLAVQTSAGQAGPKFIIDSQMAGFHFSITYINGPYLLILFLSIICYKLQILECIWCRFAVISLLNLILSSTSHFFHQDYLYLLRFMSCLLFRKVSLIIFYDYIFFQPKK